jgi:hypothetical protein
MLAQSIPQVFAVIPNPMNIRIPASSNLPASYGSISITPVVLSQDQYPAVRWWKSKLWKQHADDAGDYVSMKKSRASDSESDSDDSEEKANILGFLEHADGTPFCDEDIKFTRQCAQKEFNSCLTLKIAPPRWSQASAEVTTRFRNNMIAQIPDLNLCANFWKVDAVGTEVYSQWARYRRADIDTYWKQEPPSRRGKKGGSTIGQSTTPLNRRESGLRMRILGPPLT